MKILILFLFFFLYGKATVFNIYNYNLQGLILEKGDIAIVSKDFKYIKDFKSHGIKIIECNTEICRSNNILDLKHKYRTNEISVLIVK